MSGSHRRILNSLLYVPGKGLFQGHMEKTELVYDNNDTDLHFYKDENEQFKYCRTVNCS